MSKLFGFGLLLLGLFSVQQHLMNDSNSAKDAFSRSDQLIESLLDFEKNRTGSKAGLEQAYQRIDTILQQYELENSRELTIAFEEVWENNVISRIARLNVKFELVKERSNRYFQMLFEISRKIKDEELSDREMQLNQKLQERWKTELAKAEGQLTIIEEKLQSGNDLFNIMLASSLRMTLTQHIEEIKELTLEAEGILQELKQLTNEGLEMAMMPKI